MAKLLENLKETQAFLVSQYPETPTVGIVLGSGLGNFATKIQVEKEIPYDQIPHFPVSTVQGHSGKLIFGTLGGKKVVAMAGRFHFYEGYSMDQVVYPIRVFKALGVETLLLSNAAGGVNPNFKVGDLMIIKDHIHLSIPNPLIGKNVDELGPRFPDMSEPYSKAFIQTAKEIAKELDYKVQEGVYYAVTGPTFETHAEYKMIHILGGDAVGMSTVPEVIIAMHGGMKVFAMSVITDIGIRDMDNTITHDEVLEAAHAAEPKLTAIYEKFIERLP